MKLFGKNNKNQVVKPLQNEPADIQQNSKMEYKPMQNDPTNIHLNNKMEDNPLQNDPIHTISFERPTPCKVVYNGGTECYYPCDEPTSLIVGKEYEVIQQIDLKFQTNYVLSGIDGEFNSIWFDSEEDLINTYQAIGYKRNPPRIGFCFNGYRIEFTSGGMPVRTALQTSTVQKVKVIGKDMLKVRTRNSIYIVYLILE